MGKISPAQFAKSAITVVIMVGILGVAFGESLYRKANYVTFLTTESFPTMNLLYRDKLVSENSFTDEGGIKHRLFVFESEDHGGTSTCRVVVTDEDYHVTSTWNADRTNKLLNVGFMEHTSPPVLEIVRHDSNKSALTCEHLCLHMGVLQAYQYRPRDKSIMTQ
ncbi:hypothetical protein C5Y96_07160 [Blastopirellula marina]|uniref:Uncharacterized protein n=1 Tax=Blastopirellula marina TaxID=124 RepID=A0A2S8FYL0_9BACT|nr:MULTISPECIES: hypothetical protein [Pirellulaceae]PQO36934.1 hypothetical protein C5Y96_07160 [Blastopirellula marina]RCS53649.1 hypothetical protein DTL36_07170 [Bremerella cremea]